VIPQQELTAEKLAAAIRQTFEAYESYQERAQLLAEMIQAEGGAKSAARRIAAIVNGKSRLLDVPGRVAVDLESVPPASLYIQ
jgi:UDP:flavonoid glycosyltransferase YjiC (YdhE family)